jgi:sensor histidine kinase YesM
MKKVGFYLLHALVICVVLAFGTLSAISLSIFHKNQSITFHSIDATLAVGSFLGLIYFAYWLFIPQFLVKKQYFKFILGLLAIVVGFSLYFNLTALFVEHVLKIRFHLFQKNDWVGIACYAIILGTAGTLFRVFIQWFNDSQTKIELEKQNFKSELALLKNQLNPHFLFNTLNNIDALINQQSPNASLALNKLSQIMRYVVYDSEKEWVNLQHEINYIQNYISLQKLRISNPNMIDFTVTGNINQQQIAPMLFIPFVENMFKHSSLKDRPGNKIEIKITINANQMEVYCRNAIAHIHKNASSGVGLALLKKRLAMIYKNQHTLTIDNDGENFTVHLILKLV